jgi:hypothetical protein
MVRSLQDALVTVWIRQFSVRTLFTLKSLVSVHMMTLALHSIALINQAGLVSRCATQQQPLRAIFGRWCWTVFIVIDFMLSLLGIQSSAHITPARGTAARAPLLGVVRAPATTRFMRT